MRLINNVLGTFIAIAVLSSCNKVEFKKTKGGMPYKLFSSKNGKKIDTGSFVKVHIMQKIKDSVVFSSYQSLPVYIPVNPSTETYNISEVIPLLKEGDSVYATQLMDTFIARDPMILQQTPFRKGDKVITTLKVLKVFPNDAEAKKDEEKENLAFLQNEDAAVRNYLSKNKITAQKTGKGTYVEIMDPGQGPKADPGKYVSLKYKGTTFSGKVFDSNMDTTFGHTDPLSFTVGQQQMLRGFDEGVQVLHKGGKARLYIPSMLAYGPRPPSPVIKPYEHLIFEIQVLDIKDKAPEQPGMPQGIDTTGGAPR
ncbi:MAG: FKBP-type peptidyl-prolyl cis-trans isomerase [Chitinophagaceae bacterium]